MIHPKNMTIDAYLRQAGIKAARPDGPNASVPLKRAPAPRFGQVLDAVRTTGKGEDAGQSSGATIADYLNRRPPAADSSLFRHSTLRGGVLGGSADIRHRFLPLVGMPKPAIQPPDPDDPAPSQAPMAAADEPDVDTRIDRSIRAAAKKYDLSVALIESIIRTESNYQPDAVSPAGAQGLMQLMPATARELGVTDPFDIQQNIDGGARYVRQMLDRFDGDIKLALSAYNAGPGTVARFDGDVPYPETRNYVRRVLAGLRASETFDG